MDKTEKITFNTTLLLVTVIIAASLIIFMLTPSPISPTRRFFGYITGVHFQNNTTLIEFDKAEWFSDTENSFPASTACKLDGACPACPLPIDRSCVPNGYYIRNVEPNTQKYPVAGFTKIGTLIINPEWNSQDPESQPYRTLTLDEFREIFLNPTSEFSYIKSAPFNITTIAGQVIIINQQYIP